MKGIVFMMVMGVMLLSQSAVADVKEIPGKPTYEQTIAFIILKYPREYRLNFENNYGMEAYIDQKISAIDLVDICSISFTYFSDSKYYLSGRDGGWRNDRSSGTVKRTIDFGKVETIGIGGKGGNGHKIYGLFFKQKDKEIADKWDLPIAAMQGDFEEVAAKIKEFKEYKAFDHLRKLCGAPEPLEF